MVNPEFVPADFRKGALSPARKPAPLATRSTLFLSMCLTEFSRLPVGDRGNLELRYCMCDQNEIPGTISDLAVLKIVL